MSSALSNFNCEKQRERSRITPVLLAPRRGQRPRPVPPVTSAAGPGSHPSARDELFPRPWILFDGSARSRLYGPFRGRKGPTPHTGVGRGSPLPSSRIFTEGKNPWIIRVSAQSKFKEYPVSYSGLIFWSAVIYCV